MHAGEKGRVRMGKILTEEQTKQRLIPITHSLSLSPHIFQPASDDIRFHEHTPPVTISVWFVNKSGIF